MTIKRYKEDMIDLISDLILDLDDGEYVVNNYSKGIDYLQFDIKKVYNDDYRLNELHEENKQLKSEIKDLKFKNEEKYREIKQLEQMLQDVKR